MLAIGYSILTVQIGLTVITELLRRKVAVESSDMAAPLSAAAYLIQVVIGAIVLLVIDFELVFSWEILTVVMILAIAPPLREFLQFRANEKVDAGSLSVMLNLTTIVTVGFAAILLDDVLSNIELVGMFLILIGAWLVARLTAKGTIYSWLLVVLVAPLIFLDSAGNLGEAWFISEYSLALYLFYGLVAQSFWALVIMGVKRIGFRSLGRREVRRSVVGYISTRAVKGILFLAALSMLDSIATVKAILAVTPVAITIAAYFVLGESEHLKTKLFAAVIAGVGLITFAV